MADDNISNGESNGEAASAVVEPQQTVAAEPEAGVSTVPLVETPAEQETAHMGGDEPLGSAPQSTTASDQTASSSAKTETSPSNSSQPVSPSSAPASAVSTQVIATTASHNPIRELFAKAQQAIQNRKRKKLDHLMTLFIKQTHITNDEVEKLLHVSDATATRYLSILEQEGKIKQSSKTGKGVVYTRI